MAAAAYTAVSGPRPAVAGRSPFSMLWTRRQSPPKLGNNTADAGETGAAETRGFTAANPGEEIMDHFSRIRRSIALLSAVTAATLALAAPASAQETFKLGT